MEKALREEIISILQEARHMILATVRLDGYPQATTVAFASEGLRIVFGCREHSQKAVNLARDHKISAAINLPFKSWKDIRGLSIGGTATTDL
jgi:pyridoxine/pyridoxamine 5'-phosphate oxidase